VLVEITHVADAGVLHPAHAPGGRIEQGASAEKLASSLLKSMKNHSLYQFFYFNFNDYFLCFPEIPSL
jgi:hypothetical protein